MDKRYSYFIIKLFFSIFENMNNNFKFEKKYEGIINCFIWFYLILNICKRYIILYFYGYIYI